MNQPDRVNAAITAVAAMLVGCKNPSQQKRAEEYAKFMFDIAMDDARMLDRTIPDDAFAVNPQEVT